MENFNQNIDEQKAEHLVMDIHSAIDELDKLKTVAPHIVQSNKNILEASFGKLEEIIHD